MHGAQGRADLFSPGHPSIRGRRGYRPLARHGAACNAWHNQGMYVYSGRVRAGQGHVMLVRVQCTVTHGMKGCPQRRAVHGVALTLCSVPELDMAHSW